MHKIARSLIYILDNEAVHGDSLKTHLIKKGFEVNTFVNSDELFANIEKKLPEIIFLDYTLSKKEYKNGVDVLIHIKDTHPAIEVVIYSGQDDIEVATDTIKHGAYDYIVKGATAVHKAEIIAANIKEKNNGILETRKLRIFSFGLLAVIAIFAILVIVFWSLGIFSEN